MINFLLDFFHLFIYLSPILLHVQRWHLLHCLYEILSSPFSIHRFQGFFQLSFILFLLLFTPTSHDHLAFCFFSCFTILTFLPSFWFEPSSKQLFFYYLNADYFRICLFRTLYFRLNRIFLNIYINVFRGVR